MQPVAYEKNFDFEENYWWFVGRREIVMNSIKKWGGRFPRILDFGCGTGFTMTELSRLGTVYGVDASPTALDFCKRRNLTNVYLLDDDPSVLKEKFDLITMLDVLEHIDDDVKALESLREKLSAGGLLCITVPAYQFLWGEEDVISDHKRRYTRSSLIQAVRKAGLEVVWCGNFNFLLLPVIAAFVFLQKFKGPDSERTGSLIPLPKPINAILRAILKIESQVLKRIAVPIGASIVLIARN